MTLSRAAWEIKNISTGTIAVLTGKSSYKEINQIIGKWLIRIGQSNEDRFDGCENWEDVLRIVE